LLKRRMGDNTAKRRFFSTDALPERDRFPAFCEEFVRRHTALDIVSRGEEPFRAAIEMQQAGPVVISSHVNTPVDFLRSPHLLRDGNDAIVIALIRSGSAYQTQRGYDLKLGAGEAIVCDNVSAGALNWPTDAHWTSVAIERARITELLPGTARLAGAKLDRDHVALRLLFNYLAGTLDVDLSGGRAVQLYGEHILDLVALALGANDDARELVEQRSVRAVRRAAIVREIESRATDPRLNADAIARQHGITPRYLRLLLEATGRSFAEHVLEKRLERVWELLRDPRQQGRKISAIAFACGFGDLSYFNQAFRRRYGATPSDVRESARRQDSD
jgi:AraC-like DNA-binding protein